MKNEELVGKTLKKLEITDDKSIIKLICNDGCFYLIAEGDCCSESWFDHLSMPYELSYLGVGEDDKVEILSYEEIELGKVIPSRQYEDEIYGYKFTTNKGDILIEMRNSSNGYYGGRMTLCDRCSIDYVFEPIEESF